MNRQITFAVLAAAALAACAEERRITGPSLLSANAPADKSSCPSGGTPAPGSRVVGRLEVDGTCILNGVTVNGGITVDAGGHLQVQSSTVNGGISVLQCGELDVNASVNGAGVPTGTTSTINGGLVINASAACTFPAFSDIDIWTAQINGGISVTGNYAVFPRVCGNKINGDVDIDNVTAPSGSIGDPDGFSGCPGNTITGALSMSNSSDWQVESNRVSGSVLLSASRLELNGNTIGGSLLCSNGTLILPGGFSDPSGNTVRGANTCDPTRAPGTVKVVFTGVIELIQGLELIVPPHVVLTNAATEVRSGGTNLTLADLRLGEEVQVIGTVQPDGSVLAEKIKVKH